MDSDPGGTRSPGLYTVFGGTGFLGHRVVRVLLDQGCRVRVAARNPSGWSDRSDGSAPECVQADLFDADSVKAALEGSEGVLNATSLYLEKGELTFESMHVDAACRLATFARQAGVRRLVQMSGIGADPTAGDSYIRSRGRGEEAVRSAFPGASIVRSAVMFGKGDALVSTTLATARLAPVFPLFGAGRTRLQPVLADDVARAITAGLIGESAAPLYEFGGPRVLEYRQLVREILDSAGLRRPLVRLPFPVWRMIATVSEHLPGAPLTRSQIALLERDTVANDALPGLAELGVKATDLGEYLQANP